MNTHSRVRPGMKYPTDLESVCGRLDGLQEKLMRFQENPDVWRMLSATYQRELFTLVRHYSKESIRQYGVYQEFYVDYLKSRVGL